MDPNNELVAELVTASHILANEGVCDAFGHISVRHPSDSQAFMISCSRSPELVSSDDIMTLDMEGRSVDSGDNRKPFLERFIHAGIYAARPDVFSVVHNHARECVALGVSDRPAGPAYHMAAAIGNSIPIWDIRDRFGDTNLLVSDLKQGHDLATCIGGGTTALMRGHGAVVAQGSIKEAVLTAIYLQANADIVIKAATLGEINYLSQGEIELAKDALLAPIAVARAWEYFVSRLRSAN